MGTGEVDAMLATRVDEAAARTDIGVDRSFHDERVTQSIEFGLQHPSIEWSVVRHEAGTVQAHGNVASDVFEGGGIVDH
jgi:hypothetical protein